MDEKTSRLHATYFPITNFPCCVQSLICSPRLFLSLRGRRMDLRFSPASSVVSSAGTWWAGFWNSGHPSFFQEFQCSSRYNPMWHDNPQHHAQITKVTAQFWGTRIAQLVQSLVQRINDKLGSLNFGNILFSSPKVQIDSGTYPLSYTVSTNGYFPDRKVTILSSWTLIFNQYWGSECVELHLHPHVPIWYDAKLSTGTTTAPHYPDGKVCTVDQVA